MHRTTDTTLIFLHIPKAAGTTVHHILERQFAADEVYSLAGDSWASYRRDFQRLTLPQRRKIRVVKGHMEFGLHELLPQPATYVTVLRHPVDRIMSYYYYVLATPAHYLHKPVRLGKMSLVDFALSNLTTELDNGQTRLLTATTDWPPPGQMTAAHLETAKENLRNDFSLVGVQEEMDYFLWRLVERFGLTSALVPPQNVTPRRAALDAISPQESERILERNSLDHELHQLAHARVQAEMRSLDASARARFRYFQSRMKLAARIKGGRLWKLGARVYRTLVRRPQPARDAA